MKSTAKNYAEFSGMRVYGELPCEVTNFQPAPEPEIINLPDGILWSGKSGIPAIGDEVLCKINNLGEGVVDGYVIACGKWLGLLVTLHNPPEWYKANSKRYGGFPDASVIVYGAEVGPIMPTEQEIDAAWDARIKEQM